MIERFLGEPGKYWTDFTWEEILRYEITHFFFSAYLGFLGFLLMQTILSRHTSKLPDRYIFSISFLFGVCSSVTVHMFIDAFTDIA